MEWRAFLVAASVAALAVPAVAQADRATVAVESFEGGKPARKIRQQVIEALEGGYQVKDAGADAVIGGEVVRKRGRYKVRIELRDPASDEMVVEYEFTEKRPRIGDRPRRALLRIVRAGLTEIASRQREAKQERQAEAARAKKQEEQAAARETRPRDDREVSQPATVSRAAPDPADRMIVGRVSAGVSFVGRSLAIGSGGDGTTYEGIYAPGLHADGDVAYRDMVGVEASVDRSVGLKSGVAGGGSATLPTTQSRFGVGAFYRHTLAAGKLRVQGGAGIGRIGFAIDGGDMEVVIPDAAYTYVTPSVGARFAIGQRLGVTARGGVLFVLSEGEVASPEQYGSTSTLGFDAALGVEIAVTRAIGVDLGITYAHVSFDFAGDGALASDGGGRDRYTGASVAGAYQF